jgi:hypothetical protein
MNTDVFLDLDRDLQDARALLADAKGREDAQKYRKAAEIVLLKILHADPAHAEARALLAETKTAPPRAHEELSFTASPVPVPVDRNAKKTKGPRGGTRRYLALALLVIIASAGGMIVYGTHASSKEELPPIADKPALEPVVVPEAAPTQVEAAAEPAAAAPVPPLPASPAPTAPVAPPTPHAAADMGSLAVNSPIATDIYMGDKFLGSTPTTLQLPPGKQTLEYRHGALRTVMTHEVKSKETTSALVAFETTVQINARPWAQVYLEGTTRRALGQTPLSSVRVPIGSVLTFENPNYPTASHRVSEKDSTIQVAFP